MKEIWVVMGSSGEYSDHREWYMCFYEDESLAKRHAEMAQMEANRIKAACDAKDEYYDSWDENRERNPYDKDMQIDYTGANYTALKLSAGWFTKDGPFSVTVKPAPAQGE